MKTDKLRIYSLTFIFLRRNPEVIVYGSVSMERSTLTWAMSNISSQDEHGAQ